MECISVPSTLENTDFQQPLNDCSVADILFFILFIIFLSIFERKSERERNIDLLIHSLIHLLVDSYMCPAQGSNPQTWYIGMML